LKQLQDIDNIQGQLIDLFGYIDKEESKLTGEMEFPHDNLTKLGVLSFEELICYGNETLEQFVWELNEVIRRIDIQTNRIDKILGWVIGKLSKAVAMMPPGVLDYRTQEEKYHLLALEYPVVKFLLEEKEEYQRQQLHWRHMSKNLQQKCWSLKFRLEKLNKSENNNEENYQ
jgi:hypothetical protein